MMRKAEAAATASTQSQRRSRWIPLLAFVVSAIGLILIGFITYQSQRDQNREHIAGQLRAIGDYRVAQLSRWIVTTRSAIEFFGQGGQVSDHFSVWAESNFRDSASVDRIQARIADLQATFGYHSISLFDLTGQYRLGNKSDAFMVEHQHEALRAIQQRTTVLVDFHPHGLDRQEQMLGMAVPLIQGRGRDSRVIGAMLIAIPARASLFPRMLQWPTPSPSGETVLARIEGNAIRILFASRLNNLQGIGPLVSDNSLRLPLANLKAGGQGILANAVDFRQRPVLAYGNAVKDTPWFVVVKLDRDEVEAPVFRIAVFSALGTGLLLVLSSLFIGLWWRGQVSRQRVQLLGKDVERRVMERRYDYLSRFANDVIALSDDCGVILEINQQAEPIYGYTQGELIGQSGSLLYPPEARVTFDENVAAVLAAGNLVFETEHQRKDGSRFPVEISARLIEIQDQRKIHLLMRDITQRKQAEAALRESEAYNKLLFADSRIAMVVMDPETGRFIDCNQAAVEIYALPDRNAVLALPVGEVSAAQQYNGEASASAAARHIATAMDTGGEVFEWRHRRPNGEIWDAQVNLMRFQHGPRTLLQFSLQDITARKHAEDRLRQAATLFENSRDGVTITDAQANILAVNPAFCAITGYSEAEVLGRNPRILQSGRHDAEFYAAMWSSLTVAGHWSGEIWNRRKDGQHYPEWLAINAVRDAAGQITQYIAIGSDLSARYKLQAKLEYQTYHSALTGLPNAASLIARIKNASVDADADDSHLALLVLNINRFSQLNETLGRAAGDRVLQALARRWSEVLGENCLLTHLGADQFAVLQQGGKETEVIATLARLQDCMREPVDLNTDPSSGGVGNSVALTLSIGVAYYPADAGEAGGLLHAAEDAMRNAKSEKGNQVRFFDRRHAQTAIDWFETEAALRLALPQEELFLVYQPQVDANNGRVVAVESLIRWRHNGQVVPPGRFIHVVEGTDLAEPVSRWVLQTACRQARQWLDRNHPVRVAVNIFSDHVTSGHLLDDVRQALDATSLPPSLLEIEVVESSLLKNPETAAHTLREIKRLGVGLALDDFGTGYSSLGYLKHYPFDVLKIDQLFARNVTRDPEDAAIVRSTIALAHNLGMRVLAEGVETEPQLRFMVRYGCDEIQGYLTSRPTTPEEVETRVMQCRDLRPASLSQSLAKRNVLVVEDEPVEAELLAVLLQDAGYGTYAAADLEGALAVMGKERIDLVVSDHYLAETTGVEVLARLRRLFPDVPRIMVSGAEERDVVVDALNRAGIRAFLPKPVEPQSLLNAIQRLLDKPEPGQEDGL